MPTMVAAATEPNASTRCRCASAQKAAARLAYSLRIERSFHAPDPEQDADPRGDQREDADAGQRPEPPARQRIGDEQREGKAGEPERRRPARRAQTCCPRA